MFMEEDINIKIYIFSKWLLYKKYGYFYLISLNFYLKKLNIYFIY